MNHHQFSLSATTCDVRGQEQQLPYSAVSRGVLTVLFPWTPVTGENFWVLQSRSQQSQELSSPLAQLSSPKFTPTGKKGVFKSLLLAVQINMKLFQIIITPLLWMRSYDDGRYFSDMQTPSFQMARNFTTLPNATCAKSYLICKEEHVMGRD